MLHSSEEPHNVEVPRFPLHASVAERKGTVLAHSRNEKSVAVLFMRSVWEARAHCKTVKGRANITHNGT